MASSYRQLISTLFTSLALGSGLASAEPAVLACSFESHADPEDGLASNEPFEFSIAMDPETSKSYIVGNMGTSDLHTIPTDRSLVFIEMSDSGNVMTTTVMLKGGLGTRAGDAVHSRHTVMGSALLPSQYYGRCVFT